MLYWHNWSSWWWARGCSKHVENWNKHIEKNCASSWSFTKKLILLLSDFQCFLWNLNFNSVFKRSRHHTSLWTTLHQSVANHYTWYILILPSHLHLGHPIISHPSSLCIPWMLHTRSLFVLSSYRYFGDSTANLYNSSVFHFLYSCPCDKRPSFTLIQTTGKMIRNEVCTQWASKFSA